MTFNSYHSVKTSGELYVAMEYLPNGDLRSYLRNARSMDGEASISSDLLQFALDVAKGMQHLAATGVSVL